MRSTKPGCLAASARRLGSWHGSARKSVIAAGDAGLRSPAFLSFLAPLLAETFGSDPAWDAGNLFRLATRVERGHIRVDADEVTYPAHVLLRYGLSRRFCRGICRSPSCPRLWAEAARGLLGVEPPDDRHGCLQDIHWYDGAFGYFPTYTLGAMAAAQLYRAALAAQPEIAEDIARGDLSRLLGWLRRGAWARSLLEWEALIEQASGHSPLTRRSTFSTCAQGI